MLQIGGPRGEKGQKGEPAIIEPVRTTSLHSVWCGALGSTAEKKISHYLGHFSIKYCNYFFLRHFTKQLKLGRKCSISHDISFAVV